MLCSSCGADNRPGRKFCAQCGAPLALACSSCGARNEPNERFCGECGGPLAGQGAAATPAAVTAGERGTPGPPPAHPPAAERRLVSVLFADLVGFTTLSEHRDPEEVRELLSRYFDTARELIGRYGGLVEKFIGDAVMAVWGTPVAHEDDAERATRAALDLVDAVAALGSQVGAPDLRLRAGVLTGEAAVTMGAEGQGMVAGDLVNTASRLQSAAAPGTVLVGESTYHAASKAISFEDAGEHVLKGKELPVRAWRAVRVVSGRGGLKRAEQLEAPFVGREGELRLVKDLFHTTARERRPRLVSLMGIGGIGKSRLAWEFFKYIDGLAETIYWHQGRSPAYGEGVTFWALGEMVRMRARIAETDDPQSSRAKLRATLDEYVPDNEERRWVEPRLAHLLGLEGAPAGEREDLFAAWRTFFERVADKGAAVLVFEDLQWADSGQIDFVEHLLEWSRQSPIFILTLARPELQDRRTTWGAGQRNFTSVYLDPLSDEAMAQLLGGLVPGLPERITRQILERAEGVPLYAVETVRMLLDRGLLASRGGAYELKGDIERLEVPETLHALIAARLDSLSPDDRSLLQDASILGKTFTLQALSAVTAERAGLEPRLKDLVRKEMLVVDADPRSPERGQYGFVQSLIREVAYQTLSRADRRARHLAAAHYFESLGDEELAGVVATHYIEAYKATPQGPDAQALAARARDSLVTAAERAGSLGSHSQALAYLEEALEVTMDPEERSELWERAAEAAQQVTLFETAESYLRQAVEWHKSQGHRSAAARTTARLGRAVLSAGSVDTAIQILQDAAPEMADVEADASGVELHAELARAYMIKGDPPRTRQWADKALLAAERLDLLPIIAEALITKGVALAVAGQWRESIALLNGALMLAQQEGLPSQELRARANISNLMGVIDPGASVDMAVTGLDLARKLGLREWELFLLLNGAASAIHSGRWQWAMDSLRESYTEDIAPFYKMGFGCLQAILSALRGEREAAEAFLEATRPIAEGSDSPQDLAQLREAEGLVALTAGRLEQAVRTAREAARADPGGPEAIRAYTMGGRAAVWSGDRDGAVTALMGLEQTHVHGPWVTNSRKTLRAGIAALEGRRDEAVSIYQEAAAGWRALEAHFDFAMSQLDFATLNGPDETAALAAAEEAREIFTRLEAKPFLERLKPAVPVTQLA